MLHENGKKHVENVERALQEKRIKKEQEENAQKFLSDSLKQMEQAALAGTGVVPVPNSNSYSSSNSNSNTYNHNAHGHGQRTRPPPPVTSVQSSNNWNNYPLRHQHPHPYPPSHYSNQNHNHRPPHQQGDYQYPAVGSSQSGPRHAAPAPVPVPPPQILLNPRTPAGSSRIVPSNYSSSSQLEQEKLDWQVQKLKRQEDNNNKRKKREAHDSDQDDDDEDEDNQQDTNKRPKITILPGEGYYSYDGIHKNKKEIKQENSVQEKDDDKDKTDDDDDERGQKTTIYLEGEVFFGLLEEDMPVQFWTGPSCSRIEKQQVGNTKNWKNALTVAVVYHRRPKTSTSTAGKCDGQLLVAQRRPTIHVSYLSSPEDTEETIEKKVPLDRIRIVLGGDDKIPDDLEEARLLAMGGEEINVSASNKSGNGNGNADAGAGADVDVDPSATNYQQQDINEATGLSGWSTVTIKKTTHRQQHREEKERFAEMKIQAAQKREAEKKRIVERRLEEARASNADDSALGAYDIWGKMDYKGVDISKEIQCSVQDTAKRLAPVTSAQSAGNGTGTATATATGTGGKVAFKKRAKKKGQRAARRRTSADDDDD